jgi:hypothetical protein
MARSLLVSLGSVALVLLACKPKEVGVPVGALSSGGGLVTIEAAPEHLRGYVALHAGARLYAGPRHAATSWTLSLPEAPLDAANDELPRARVLRVVGMSGEFLALTNDLAAPDDGPFGCGEPIAELTALRMLFYVPIAHLAPVVTRPLELVPLGNDGTLRVGAGARVGPALSAAGMPSLPDDSHWRALDADGLRALVPVPDDAVGLAFDPSLQRELVDEAGQLVFRDAEGSYAYLLDRGDEAALALRNACGEHVDAVAADEVAALRELAAANAELGDAGFAPPEFVAPPQQPWRLVEGADLRWTDGNLAAEVLAPLDVPAPGQDWEDRRCFPLLLGSELEVVDRQPPVACVRPDRLEYVGDEMVSFDRNLEVELGGSVRFGQPSLEGPWGPDVVRELLNDHHGSIAECLRPLVDRLDAEGLPYAARWRLELQVDGQGRVRDAAVEAALASDERVEDCLRADTGTWLLPPGAGTIVVDLEFGNADLIAEQLDALPETEPEPEPKPKAKAPKSKSKSKSESEDESPEPGRVMIIRDEEDAELEPLPDE